jgi:hypothetical protein
MPSFAASNSRRLTQFGGAERLLCARLAVSQVFVLRSGVDLAVIEQAVARIGEILGGMCQRLGTAKSGQAAA